MKRLILSVVGLLLAAGMQAQQLHSPDGNLTMTFSLDSEGAPHYMLTYKQKTVIAPSRLGLELKSSARNEFGSDFTGRTHTVDPKTSLYDGFEVAGRRDFVVRPDVAARMGRGVGDTQPL